MTTLFLGLALVTSAPALKGPVKGDAPPIEGTWQVVEWLQGGRAQAFWEGTTVEFRADGKRLCRESADVVDERSYKLIPKTSPPAIDLIRPNPGGEPTVHPCIYKIDGDTLIICVGLPTGDRPASFDSAQAGVRMLMAYKRVKKKE
jgi:uncharacterized protein (TIGR03067 family)